MHEYKIIEVDLSGRSFAAIMHTKRNIKKLLKLFVDWPETLRAEVFFHSLKEATAIADNPSLVTARFASSTVGGRRLKRQKRDAFLGAVIAGTVLRENYLYARAEVY